MKFKALEKYLATPTYCTFPNCSCEITRLGCANEPYDTLNKVAYTQESQVTQINHQLSR